MSDRQSPNAEFAALAEQAARLAVAYREAVSDAPAESVASADELRALFDLPLTEEGRDGVEVINALARAATPGLTGISGPNLYAWVMGGSHPVGVAADWLTSAWGQNAGIYQTAPAAAIAEEVVSKWMLDLLELPPESSVGLTTGATMAGFVCLAAARSEVMRRAGWDLEKEGMAGGPPLRVFLGAEAHTTIFSALRYLGVGERQLGLIQVDDQGRMDPADLAKQLGEHIGPKIIICQAGHINSGAFDPIGEIAALVGKHDAWLHVDGAFGLWARAVPHLKALCPDAEKADSWSVDGHKWLQTPYDCGFAIVRDPIAHTRAMNTSASYLNQAEGDGRVPGHFAPELSRRARGFAAWAVLQTLGRQGIIELVSRHCALAKSLAARLEIEPGIEVLNDVCLNQVTVAFGSDEATEKVIEAIRAARGPFVRGADWKGRQILRVSIISNETQQQHIDELADLVVTCWRRIRDGQA